MKIAFSLNNPPRFDIRSYHKLRPFHIILDVSLELVREEQRAADELGETGVVGIC